jgi:hypothetical protein
MATFWVRASIWKKIVLTFNVLFTSLQGYATSMEANNNWHYLLMFIQLFGNIIAFWTEDRNNDGVIDVAQTETEIITKIKTAGPVIDSETEVKQKEEPPTT